MGTCDLRPVGKGLKKKKKTLVLTLGRSGAYTANPPEKGEKKKTVVLTLGSPPEKGEKKRGRINPGQPAGKGRKKRKKEKKERTY